MFSSVSQAFQSLFSHKLRSFLTMLGIIIGIGAIITIVSTIKGTAEQIKDNFFGDGRQLVTVRLYQDDMLYEMMYSPIPVGIAVPGEQERVAICALESIKNATFYRERTYADRVYYGNTAFNGKLVGVDAHYFEVNGLQIRRGRGFTERDFAQPLKNVILDDVAVRSMFGTQDPIGATVEICGEPFTVIGVAEVSSDFEPVINSREDYDLYAVAENGTIYMTNTVWPVVYMFDEPMNLMVSATSTDDMTVAGKEAADYCTENLVAEAVRQNGMSYRSNDRLEQAEQMQEMSNATNQQLIWIAGISLLVGGVGVMNIMLVNVTERTAEIGLRKAVGAKRRRILTQFLTEAAVLTGIGGVLGVCGGWGLSELISRVAKTPTAISVPAVIAAVAFSVVIGLFFGLLPAIKASNLSPIEALRRD